MAKAKTDSATPKPSAKRATAREPAIKSLPADELIPESDSPNFKRGDLLNAVAERSALPKSDLRAVIELVLDEMGTALSSGRDLALQPLGHVKVKRRHDTEGAEVLALRLRRKTEVPS